MESREELGRRAYELGIRLGAAGPVVIGAAGGTLAAALARCVGCGAVLFGADIRRHDGSCAACGVWLADYYGFPSAVFLRQDGADVHVHVREPSVIPAGAAAPCTGDWETISGADSGWAARRAAGHCPAKAVASEGTPALRLLLERMGCDVLDRPMPGVPLLRSDPEGFDLVVCRDGVSMPLPGVDALAAAADWLIRSHAVPAFRTGMI